MDKVLLEAIAKHGGFDEPKTQEYVTSLQKQKGIVRDVYLDLFFKQKEVARQPLDFSSTTFEHNTVSLYHNNTAMNCYAMPIQSSILMNLRHSMDALHLVPYSTFW